MRFRMFALVGDPPVDHGLGATGTAQVFHSFRVGLAVLPAGELDQGLVFAGVIALKAIIPCHPPDFGVVLQFSADIAVVTLAS